MTKQRRQLLTTAAEAIRKANRILLACHVRPDADALGSLLGLALALRAAGKQVDAYSPDGVPAAYTFLPGSETVVTAATGAYDLAIGMDADGADRLGVAAEAVLAAPVTIDLDHHTSAHRYGQIQVVDATAAATGELVFGLLEVLELPVTPEVAQCLMAAIMTDTGSFRFSNVTPECMRVAAALIEAGARPSPIYEAVYGNRSFGASKLLGRLLDGLDRSGDGRIVWAGLPHAEFVKLDVGTDATEGFMEQIRMVEGSQVALFFREEAGGEIRVSLRSRGNVNVARVAETFGGGGHVPAAGCTLLDPLPVAIERVVAAAQRELDQTYPSRAPEL